MPALFQTVSEGQLPRWFCVANGTIWRIRLVRHAFLPQTAGLSPRLRHVGAADSRCRADWRLAVRLSKFAAASSHSPRAPDWNTSCDPTRHTPAYKKAFVMGGGNPDMTYLFLIGHQCHLKPWRDDLSKALASERVCVSLSPLFLRSISCSSRILCILF